MNLSFEAHNLYNIGLPLHFLKNGRGSLDRVYTSSPICLKARRQIEPIKQQQILESLFYLKNHSNVKNVLNFTNN